MAHPSLYYFCLLQIIMFQAKENRRGGCYYKCMRERSSNGAASPSSEQSQEGEIPIPADSQGQRWSRSNPRPCLAAEGSGAFGRGLSPTLPIWVGACAQCQARCAHTCTHMHSSQGSRQGDADPHGTEQHGHWYPRSHQHPMQSAHPGMELTLLPAPVGSCLLSLVPASPAAAPAGFYGNSVGKHGRGQAGM